MYAFGKIRIQRHSIIIIKTTKWTTKSASAKENQMTYLNWLNIRKTKNSPNELYFKLYQNLTTKYFIQISNSFFNPYGGLGEGQLYEKVKKKWRNIQVKMKYVKSELRNKEKKKEIWLSPMTKIRKPKDNTQTPPKTSITQRLRTDLGRSVGVTSHPTGVVKPVYGYPTFPLTAKTV